MSHPSRPFRPLVTAAALLTLCAAPAAFAQSAAEGSRCKALRPLELRILDKADQGMVALRQFVVNTRMIYELDVTQVADSLEGLRARNECVKAEAAAARQVAAAQPQR
jgi:hypothetical protein